MKKITNTILILLLLSNYAYTQKVETTNCERKATFGEAEICLPQIEGYKECYTDPIVKELADGTEIPANTVLGFYMEEKTLEKKDSFGLFSFDNYFKIYGTKQLKDLDADTKALKEIQDVIGGNFIAKNWESMMEEIDKVGLEAEIGVPTVVKTYNLNEKSFTYVMLTKYQVEGVEPYTIAMTINGLLLNDRLVWMAYYLNYNGVETIPALQEQSDVILTRLLDADK